MYSNDRKNGFSILDLLVKIIFAGLFIFILVWLFQKKVPNMKPFYSNVFRENIKYMQEAGESYFTDDKMPTEEGQEVKITLAEMLEKKLLLPFVDEDGNACNQYSSYVSLIKTELGYELKTNLVCNTESDYVIKVLGCHNYCKDDKCEKKCTVEKITQYQFKKLVTGTKTNYSCKAGYTLDGKYCIKSVVADTKDATTKKEETTTLTESATPVVTAGTKTKVNTIVTEKKRYVNRVETVVPGTTTTKREAYDCTKTQTKPSCKTIYTQVPYNCDCVNKFINGQTKTTCNVCYKSVPEQKCEDIKQEYTDTCYRDVTTTTPSTTKYSCPVGSKSEGSGSNLKCYVVDKTYSCPSTANLTEGSGSSLKCYQVTNGKIEYKCSKAGYTLNGKTCTKVEPKVSYVKSCASGYKLEGDKCVKYTTEKVNATAKKVNTKYYTYKWSDKKTLSGYTSTGKTRVVNGKEKCE